ncbi:MAG: O-succinylhomoserine sulfhydrylase [Rhodospirillaceae bacterium]|jgi:O-succinylhomoserine sulfhydrylase|nr:O-succinylhomoserine sulfhydrylase [Rhodospirillaceae bacterium]MBT6203513.1 O-succinylhomoserine sulfhydrylase [Rhodospirillaceae bacterium]MBT6509926.1 O-succinylhomoserine sulfhydrylase [Rhodospirillaceae bacterium]MBT7613059.1 O-succinylhomoserine sulfhydrylase [Rhodospirillaceae bacterium]MBT7648662.1 O-succinylhomoserine sulfhydrylase [Rhodospirillaceae bacterium]
MTSTLTASPTWRPQTALVRGGTTRSEHDETSEALYMTSGYVYGSAEEAAAAFSEENPRYIYSRYGNPTVSMFEERLRLLEGAEACRATSSGMAAVYAALVSSLKAGDRVVASRALFGSCHHIVANILPKFGIETVQVDGTDLDQWRDALKEGAQAVFLETPSNPTLDILDLPAISALAHAAGAVVVVDNVFASPLLQKPLELGADIVVYSATKHIDGQGRCLGGAVLGTSEFIHGPLFAFLKHTGPALSPFNAWLLLKGLETLDLRMARHCTSTADVARWLETRNGVNRTLYPFLDSHPQVALAKQQMKDGGSIVSFELDGGRPRAFRFLNALQLVDISNNLGDSKSLITHPATTTHSKLPQADRDHLGITDGLVRLHVGLEDVEDVKDDLTQALAA